MTQESSLVIDGSYGEGGGQILRSAVALAALTGRPIRIERIRAKRRNPGLQAQHLTAIRAAAAVCGAELEGAQLGSTTLSFRPAHPPVAGQYTYDVAAARKGGSAGATSLVFQAVFLPLVFAEGHSRVTVVGGTHVAWSPPYHYLADVFLPTMARLGIRATLRLERWGWYPQGGGRITGEIQGLGQHARLAELILEERGDLVRLTGFSAASNLPAHIVSRQARRAEMLLQKAGFEVTLEQIYPTASGPGTAVYLLAEYVHSRAAFVSYGRRGKPAEEVAQEAVESFLAYHATGAAVDPHLADQLVLPLAFAARSSQFTTSEITNHLLTNIWVVEQFTKVHFQIEGELGLTGKITVHV